MSRYNELLSESAPRPVVLGDDYDISGALFCSASCGAVSCKDSCGVTCTVSCQTSKTTTTKPSGG